MAGTLCLLLNGDMGGSHHDGFEDLMLGGGFCCSAEDCSEIPLSWVKQIDDGYIVTVPAVNSSAKRNGSSEPDFDVPAKL